MGQELSQAAKDVVTQVVIGLAANTAANLASIHGAVKAAGEQNINPTLAKSLIEDFKKLHGLKTPVSYTKTTDKEQGPYFDTDPAPHGRIAGPSGETARQAIKDRKYDRMYSIDSPTSALHELGHAKRHADGAWSSRAYGHGWVSEIGSIMLMGAGFPGTAAVVAALGSIPTLYEEHKASALALDFLRAKLPKEEADKAARVLDHAFRSHLYHALSNVAAPVAYGFIRGAQRVRSGK